MTIDFEGKRDATAALTWPQRRTWRGPRLKQRLCCVQTVPPGNTVDDVRDALKWAYEEFESLRTTFPVGENGEPYQKVERNGSTEVHIIESGETSVESDVQAAIQELESERHDPVTDLPTLFAVVTVADVPPHIVCACSHLTLDSLGYMALRDSLDGYLSERRRPADPPLQPIERARFEESAEGRERSAAALEYWKEVIDRCPLEDETSRAAVMGSL